MKIVFTCLYNFQPYILINIKNLLNLKEKTIYVITNRCLYSKFDGFPVTLIDVDTLEDSYRYDENSMLDPEFRNGFSYHTSSRFFYIYEFMKKYEVYDVIHLENDVLTYYNTDVLIPYLKKTVYMPFDSLDRNVASIVYIPSAEALKPLLDQYDYSINDMYNFSKARYQNLLENFPIFVKVPGMTPIQESVCNASIPYVFDGAAMGQYLGGVDPRNIPGDTRGFVNESCVVQYADYLHFDKKPYLLIDGTRYPVFNLHIHSKNLDSFVV